MDGGNGGRLEKLPRMPYPQLLSFLELSGLEESCASDVLAMVQWALDELEEEHPSYEALVDIEEELLSQRFPTALLAKLLDNGTDVKKTRR
jgi:hypothetical protein